MIATAGVLGGYYSKQLLTSSATSQPSTMLKSAYACECGSGEYDCQGGTMCCTGNGCPSWCCDSCCTYGCVKSCCSCGTCGGCPTPPCQDSAPAGATLTSPANGEACFTSNTVTLTWSIGGWGNNCDGGTDTQTLYIDGVAVGVANNATSYTRTFTWGTTHTWYVHKDNGAGTSNSSTRSFTMNTCTRIVGRVWEDIGHTGAYEAASDIWSTSAVTCSNASNNNLALFSPTSSTTNRIESWGCNSVAYWMTNYFPIPGGPGTFSNINIALRTPDAVVWPNRYVSWNYAYCQGPAPTCNWSASTSGTSNVANINISNNYSFDWNNHLQWYIDRNVAPTASIYTIVGAGHNTSSSLGQPIAVVRSGYSQGFGVTATDDRVATTPWYVTIGRRGINPDTRAVTGTYAALGTKTDCSGQTCLANFNDSSVPAGYYVYYPIAEDEIDIALGTGNTSNRCNGHPGVNDGSVTGYANCDGYYVDGYQDEQLVLGDTLPSCAISGPTYMFSYPDGQAYKYPESTGFFNQTIGNHNVATDKGQEVRKEWMSSWTNPDGVFPTITQISVRASGSVSSGVYPTMQVWVGHNSTGGTRERVFQTVVGSAFTYNIPVSINDASSIDIVFANDYAVTGDRNLYVQYIDVTYELEPGSLYTRHLMPYTEANTGRVFYDRDTDQYGLPVPAGINPKDFDGYDISEVTSAGAFGYPAGNMMWSGALSFPIPLRAPVAAASTSVNLSGFPRVSLPYYDGTQCPNYTISIDANPVYTINGTLYYRPTPPSCPVALPAAPDGRIKSTGVYLMDAAGTAIPGMTATSDATNGTYTISNVPVAYRPNAYCPNCYARVCMNQMAADTGVYLAACQQMQPPTTSLNTAWGDSRLCSGQVSITPEITSGSVATVNLGFDYYQNEKWSVVLDGDVYAPTLSFDLASSPEGGFSNFFINRRVDAGTPTLGGYVFLDQPDIQLGKSYGATQFAEAGGFARNLSGLAHDFKDNWIVNYAPALPTHPNPSDIVTSTPSLSGGRYRFNSSNVYSYTPAQFNNWFNAGPDTYQINGSRHAVVVYVIGNDPDTDQVLINHRMKSQSDTDTLILVTNSHVIIDDQLQVPLTSLTSLAYNVDSGGADLSDGFLDLVILSSDHIEFDTRYDDTVDPTVFDQAIMIKGALIAQDGVLLNRDMWHILNTDYPSETVRYYPSLLPDLLSAETQDDTVSSYTGLGTFDIQTVYE